MLTNQELKVVDIIDDLIKHNYVGKEINYTTIIKLIQESSQLVLNTITYDRYDIVADYESERSGFKIHINERYTNNIHKCYKIEIDNIIPNILIKSLKNVRFNLNGFDVVYRICYYTLNDNDLTKLYKKGVLNYVFGMLWAKHTIWLDQNPNFIYIFINDIWEDIYSKFKDVIYIDLDTIYVKSEGSLNGIIKLLQFDSIQVEEVDILLLGKKRYMLIDGDKILKTCGIKVKK